MSDVKLGTNICTENKTACLEMNFTGHQFCEHCFLFLISQRYIVDLCAMYFCTSYLHHNLIVIAKTCQPIILTVQGFYTIVKFELKSKKLIFISKCSLNECLFLEMKILSTEPCSSPSQKIQSFKNVFSIINTDRDNVQIIAQQSAII